MVDQPLIHALTYLKPQGVCQDCNFLEPLLSYTFCPKMLSVPHMTTVMEGEEAEEEMGRDWVRK